MTTKVRPDTLRARKRARRRRAEAVARIMDGAGAGLVRNYELAALLGVSRQTIHNWSRRGVLPEPVRIGAISGWTGDVLRPVLAARGRKAVTAEGEAD